MNLLVIDLDGTITKSDNLIKFSYYMLFKERKFRFLMVFPLLFLLKFKLISNVKFKIWYSYLIIRNIGITYLNECAQAFVKSTSFKLNINKDVVSFIKTQKDSGKLLLSANYSFIAENVAKLLEIETCLAVNIGTENEKYNGSIVGKIPYGEEKIIVFSGFFNENKYKKTIGLGDSKSDLPILKYLDEGYLVSINKKTNKTTFVRV